MPDIIKHDTLTRFNRKKMMWISPKHPLYFESSEFKITYCAAIFMQAQLSKTVNALNNFELERLLKSGLSLNNKEIAKVIGLAKEGQRIVDDIIEIIDTVEKKHLFILDMINVSMKTPSLSEEEVQSVSIFAELLHISEKERKYLYDYIRFAFLREKEKALKVFGNMLQMGMDITMSELKYYIPELEYITSIEKKMIKAGSDLRLVDNCEIRDSIIVPKGSELHIINCRVELYGCIIVDGGTVHISNSILVNKDCKQNNLIMVKNFSDVIIEDSFIDCCNKSGVINQENGNLRISNCTITNTSKSSAIRFWGNSFKVEESRCINCFYPKKGGAIYFEKGEGLVDRCVFENCEGKKGGAVYTLSDNLVIKNTVFKKCRAIEYGAGIYYNGEAAGKVMDCIYEDLLPDQEGIMQFISDKTTLVVTDEYIINIPTILDRKLTIRETGTLNITHATVYVNNTIDMMGKLIINKSRMIAHNIDDRDMFNVVRGKICKLEDSEFDGRLKTGIFRATSTKIIARNCIFRNTNGGRAIFNAYEPEITDCIFSYCLEGAVHICAGKVYSSTFINCRNESGAGIYMYGVKGEIKNSKFVRCVADYSGGAIKLAGGHLVSKCTYEDCKPNNCT